MLDEGLPLEVTYNNAKILQTFSSMREVKVTFFNWQNSLRVGEKESPTDNGRKNFEYIIANEIEPIENLTKDEDEI